MHSSAQGRCAHSLMLVSLMAHTTGLRFQCFHISWTRGFASPHDTADSIEASFRIYQKHAPPYLLIPKERLCSRTCLKRPFGAPQNGGTTPIYVVGHTPDAANIRAPKRAEPYGQLAPHNPDSKTALHDHYSPCSIQTTRL